VDWLVELATIDHRWVYTLLRQSTNEEEYQSKSKKTFMYKGDGKSTAKNKRTNKHNSTTSSSDDDAHGLVKAKAVVFRCPRR
jgi:hypothetical protein